MIENKLHNYVIKLKYNNKNYFINTFNNAIIELENGEKVKDFEDVFEKQGFFEKNEIILKKFTSGYNSSQNDLNITISMTEGCNFNCIYCSQQLRRKANNISKEVLDQILLIINNIKKRQNVNIFFFGGEPLLQKDKIIYFVDKITKLVDSNNLNFFIETNGYLLDKEFIKHIPNLTLTVTLSLKNDHDKKRVMMDGSKTFEVIYKKLKKIKDFCRLTLRYNVDDKNLSMVEQFLKFVKINNITDYVQFSYTYNFNYENYWNNLKFEEYQKWYTIKLPILLKKYDFFQENIEKYSSICKAYMKNSFKVYSNGLISACNGQYENDCNFTIFDKEFYKKLNDLKKMNYPILDDCKKCQYLLYCGGHKFCNKNSCIFLEYDVKLYYKNKIKENYMKVIQKAKKKNFKTNGCGSSKVNKHCPSGKNG